MTSPLAFVAGPFTEETTRHATLFQARMLPAVELTAEELRVLGCLVEKELTTPQQYPLTLNALALACNQSSNRDPVVHYDEPTVEAAVTRAKGRGLARFVHPSHGRSVLRYRHELGDQLGLERRQLALLAVLMLRGPQTPGELRSRTERMAEFDGLREVEAEVEALASRQEPLVKRLPRSPGQKEDRFAHLLGDSVREQATSLPAPVEEPGDVPPPVGLPEQPVPAGPAESVGLAEPVGLAEEVWRLRDEVAALRRDLDSLRDQLGA